MQAKFKETVISITSDSVIKFLIETIFFPPQAALSSPPGFE